MNRVLVLLAASLLGTGCVVHDTCDARTVSIGWSSFLLANGTVAQCARPADCATACALAGVNQVQVFQDDSPVGTFNCSDGGVNVTGVLNDGEHLFDVEALDAGAIVLRDSITVGDSNCDNQFRDTQPSEGTVELDFHFTDVNACTTDTSSFIWFTMKDDISGDVITVDGTHSPQQYTCSSGHTGDVTPLPISFALASGNYTLQKMEEVTIPGTQEAGNCNATPFAISGATTQPISVPLTPAVACF